MNKIWTTKDVEKFTGNERDQIIAKQKIRERATTAIQDEELVLSCARPTRFRSLSGREDKERKESVRFSVIGNNLSKTSVNKSREQLMKNVTQ